MPWDKASLIKKLPEFNWASAEHTQISELESYKEFYGLNFSQTHLQQIGVLTLAEHQIVTHRYLIPNAKGTALIVHGYYDHVGLYSSLIEFCLEQQLNVISFDLPGHGLSSGEAAAIDSFQTYDAVFSELLGQIQTAMPGPLFAFGQSTGGAILINHLLKNRYSKADCPFQQTFLLAPLIRPKSFKMAKLLHPLVGLFTQTLKRGHTNSSTDPNFIDFVEHKDPLQAENLSVAWVKAMVRWVAFIEKQPSSDYPVAIIQGDHDQTVAWQHNLSVLKAKFPSYSLFIIPDGRHHLVNDAIKKRTDMYNQMSGHLSA